jgi:superfamily II DNA/RNA helicase
MTDKDGNKSSTGFRGILFVRQRISTHIVAHVVRSDQELSTLFPSVILHATNSPVTPLLNMSPSQQREALEAFRVGKVNLLIATEVAEEGLDVPVANCVIRFDEVVHTVSLAQSRGRARQADSHFVVMRERIDRPVALLETIEQEQLAVVRAFSPSALRSANGTDAKLIEAQKSRERGAANLLKDGIGVTKVLSVLNLFCKKTKVDLVETYELDAEGKTDCRLTYHSVLRDLEERSGFSPGKKTAKLNASLRLVAALQSCLE